MSRASGLIGRMIEQMAPHRGRVSNVSADVVDALGYLETVSATEALLTLPHSGGLVEIDRTTRQFLADQPNALWVADLRRGDETVTLTPFAPPRNEPLAASVPVRVDEATRERLGELRLPRDGDLLRVLSLPAGHGHVAILGMRTIAALDAEDARRVTWWVPGGGALELRVDDDGTGGTVLTLLDVVKESDAHTANAGPNVLVTLRPGAALPVVGPEEGKGPPRSAVPLFHPARSKLFDAWARYTAIIRQESVDRQTARAACPIHYTDAGQRGSRWRAVASVSQEAVDAWLGPDPQEGREVRIDQTAAIVEDDTDTARVTVESVVLRGPGQLELVMRGERGASVVPASGRLAARENRGEKVRLERERTALELLSKGAAGCPRLTLLLGTPEVATPPDMEALRPAPASPLDPSQEAAVQAIVGCKDLVAIQGPPGTGKTGVFAEAIRQIAARGRREGREYRVLVSSGQNEAISNLLQRLSGVEGVLVHTVERAARDDDEGRRFAERLEQQREQAVKSLDARLAQSGISDRLAHVREAEDAVEELRTIAAGGPRAGKRLAQRLCELADDAEAPLGHFERGEARAIAHELSARETEAAGAPQSSAHGEAQATLGLVPSSRDVPAAPEAISAWWAEVGGAWPGESRAAVGMVVTAVLESLALENAVRRSLALNRALPRLREVVAGTTWPIASRQPVTSRIPLEDRVDAWLATAARRVREAGEAITASAPAVAWRFLQSLREDSRAWARIVERHGNAVAATCSMAAKAQPEPGYPFDWVIIDEAGHATPFELLIPMVQGRRIVLIGDHRQLPPMVDEAVARRASDDAAAPLNLDGLTLFGELFRLLPRTNARRLEVQYRMHETIGNLVDTVFYRPHNEGLQTHFCGERVSPKWLVETDTPAGRRTVLRSRGVFGDAPVVWHDVAARRGCGEENPEEARAVVALLQEYDRAGVPPEDIAVICPYRRQRTKIEAELIKVETRPHVYTIDSVQGREYPVVLLCLVRTDGRAGFVASPNRLNVAISRAQRQLVFVGTASAFLHSDRVLRNAPHLHQVVAEARRLTHGNAERP